MKEDKSYFFYDKTDEEWQKSLRDPQKISLSESWMHTDTLDAWRHQRMRAPLKTFIDICNDATWLTVGDGRYGTDANFLLKSGARSVHCSDLHDTLLKIGSDKGYIREYSAQNAESLDFKESSFDFVYCKESLHHFPRPHVALYEMFRVANVAVIITEPRDQVIDKPRFGSLMRFLKKILRKGSVDQHYFEPVGNYVYSISEREINKFLLSMHYRYVAYIGCNDHYIPGVEFEILGKKGFSYIKAKLITNIWIQNFLCKFGLMRTSLITAALFKSKPSDSLIKKLNSEGWEFVTLPLNPYLDK